MPFFAEAAGLVYVGKDDPDPIRCPDCRKLMAIVTKSGNKIRCSHCRYQGTPDEFKARFTQIAEARVLVAT